MKDRTGAGPGVWAWLVLLWWASLFFAGGGREPAVWAVLAAALWVPSAAHGRLRTPRGLDVWGFWVMWVALSTMNSADPAVSLAAAARHATLVLFLFVAASAWGDHQKRLVLPMTWIGALVAGAFMLSRIRNNWVPPGLYPPNSNYTACLAAAAFASAFTAAFQPSGRAEGEVTTDKRWRALHWVAPLDHRKVRAALIAACAFFGLVLALVHSRGALLGACAGAALGLLLAGGRWGLAALALAAAAGLAGLWHSGLLIEFTKLRDPYRFSRLGIWASALAAAGDFPLMGVGPGMFERANLLHNFPVAGEIARFGRFADHAHSEPLNIAAETGWVGLCFWAAGVLATFRLALVERERRPWVAPSAAAAAAILTISLFDGVFVLPLVQTVFFGALAAALPARSDDRDWEWNRPLPKRLLAAGAALAVALAVSTATGWRPRDPEEEAVVLARRLLLGPPGEPARALLALSEAQRLNPTNAFHWLREAEVARGVGDWAAAEDLAARAVELEPNFIEARLLLAEAARRRGDLAQARRRFAEAQERAASIAARPVRSAFEQTLLRVDPARVKLLRAGLGDP